MAWIIYGLFGSSNPSWDMFMQKMSVYVFLSCIVIVLPARLRFSLIGILVLFFIIEVGLRLKNIVISYTQPITNTEKTSLWEYDQILGWKKRPNIKTHFKNSEKGLDTLVETNSRGLRDYEYAYDKKPNTKRILLLGDSFIVGLEVAKENLIDTKLEKYLKRLGKFEVINAGTRGYGTDQSYLYLINEGYKYHPGIVIYTFVANDPEDNVTVHNINNRFEKPFFI